MSFRTFVPSEEYLSSLRTGLNGTGHDNIGILSTISATPKFHFGPSLDHPPSSSPSTVSGNSRPATVLPSRARLETLPEVSLQCHHKALDRRLDEVTSVYGREMEKGKRVVGHARRRKSEIIRLLREIDTIPQQKSGKGFRKDGSATSQRRKLISDALNSREVGKGKIRHRSSYSKRPPVERSARAPSVRAVHTAPKIPFGSTSDPLMAPHIFQNCHGIDDGLSERSASRTAEEIVTATSSEMVPLTPPDWILKGNPEGSAVELDMPVEDSSDRLEAFVNTITSTISSGRSNKEAERPYVMQHAAFADPLLNRMTSSAVSVARNTSVRTLSRQSTPGGSRSAARAESRRARWREKAIEGIVPEQETVKVQGKGRGFGAVATSQSAYGSIVGGSRPATVGGVRPRKVSLKAPLETFRK